LLLRQSTQRRRCPRELGPWAHGPRYSGRILAVVPTYQQAERVERRAAEQQQELFG